MADNDVLSKIVADVARIHLQDDLPSATTYAAPMTDHYGDECFRLWVLYDGRVETPEPRMTISLYRRMRPDLLKHGIESSVFHSFIDKTEDGLDVRLSNLPFIRTALNELGSADRSKQDIGGIGGQP